MRLNQILLVLIGIGLLCGCATDRRQAAEIFGNMTYYVGNEHFAESVTLKDCEYFSPFLKMYYENKFVYGDFNHDGLKDAAVITVKNTGGNADWYILNFLINDGKKFVHKASRGLDDRAIIRGIGQEKGKVYIDMYIHQEGDCRGGPTKHVKNVYEYTGPDTFGLEKETWIDDPNAYNPQNGFVPDEITAIKIAEAILTAVYGEQKVNEQRPFSADSFMDIWTVRGSSHCSDAKQCNNKGLIIGIQQADGKILSISHEN